MATWPVDWELLWWHDHFQVQLKHKSVDRKTDKWTSHIQTTIILSTILCRASGVTNSVHSQPQFRLLSYDHRRTNVHCRRMQLNNIVIHPYRSTTIQLPVCICNNKTLFLNKNDWRLKMMKHLFTRIKFLLIIFKVRKIPLRPCNSQKPLVMM